MEARCPRIFRSLVFDEGTAVPDESFASAATGAVESARVKLNMTLRVTRVEFDPEAAELRVSGTTLSEHAGVRLGSAHTFLLELHRPIRPRLLGRARLPAARGAGL